MTCIHRGGEKEIRLKWERQYFCGCCELEDQSTEVIIYIGPADWHLWMNIHG